MFRFTFLFLAGVALYTFAYYLLHPRPPQMGVTLDTCHRADYGATVPKPIVTGGGLSGTAV
jgi:hypothetical protein